MILAIKVVSGTFVLLALSLYLLRGLVNSRPPRANAEEPARKWTAGALGRLLNRCALISVVLLLLPLDQFSLA
jgi:hypothetical protein